MAELQQTGQAAYRDQRLDLQQPSPELALGLQQLGAIEDKAAFEAKQQELLPLCEREMMAQLLAGLNSPQVGCCCTSPGQGDCCWHAQATHNQHCRKHTWHPPSPHAYACCRRLLRSQ